MIFDKDFKKGFILWHWDLNHLLGTSYFLNQLFRRLSGLKPLAPSFLGYFFFQAVNRFAIAIWSIVVLHGMISEKCFMLFLVR